MKFRNVPQTSFSVMYNVMICRVRILVYEGWALERILNRVFTSQPMAFCHDQQNTRCRPCFSRSLQNHKVSVFGFTFLYFYRCADFAAVSLCQSLHRINWLLVVQFSEIDARSGWSWSESEGCCCVSTELRDKDCTSVWFLVSTFAEFVFLCLCVWC